MKQVLAAIALIVAFSCSRPKPAPSLIDSFRIKRADSLDNSIRETRQKGDSLWSELRLSIDSALNSNTRLKRENDSLRRKVFAYRYTIKRLNYRMEIVISNPSQLKFLKSWKNRINNGVK